MTIYYVNCQSCGEEIEIDRGPEGDSIATAFSPIWTADMACTCGTQHHYTRGDVRSRNERIAIPLTRGAATL
jgi:hypothetical protein